MEMPDFNIESTQEISRHFLRMDIRTFSAAAQYIKLLPYGRNANKSDLATVFSDQCGTCSTKHAVLKKLADENEFHDLKLIIGIFRMNAENTPAISDTLGRYGLRYIPEAHSYLRYDNRILDFTSEDSEAKDFVNDLIEEIEIAPNQITDYKVAYHKRHIKNWLVENLSIAYSLVEIWNIREECIAQLS